MAKISGGAEIDFNMEVEAKELKKVCKDIWNNPEKYSVYKYGTEAAYYSFLKFLWVEHDDGTEERLADIALVRNSNE